MDLTARLAFLLFLATATAQAQPADRAPLSLGVGFGASVGGGAHVSVSTTVQRGRGIGALHVSATEYGPRIPYGFFGSTRDYTQEIALLAGGARHVAGKWQIVGLVGVSANQTTVHEAGSCVPTILFCIPGGGSSDRLGVRVGLPLEVGFHGPVVGAFGVGVRAFGNVNANQNYGGVSMDLRFNPARGNKPRR